MGGTCSAYGKKGGVYRVLVGKPEGKGLLERTPDIYIYIYIYIYRGIILRWVFRKWDVGVGSGLSWLWIRTGGGRL